MMDELDKKILEAIYQGVSLNKLDKVPENSVNWFKATAHGDVYEFVIDPKPIKQAFIDAGWEQNGFATLKGVRFYQVTTAEPSDVDYSPVPESRYGESLMTGAEWYARFEKETDSAELKLDLHIRAAIRDKILAAARKVSGIA